jgi:Icc-related predicted phosphoesterase
MIPAPLKKALYLFLLAALLSGQRRGELIGGPYVVQVTPTSATIGWVVQPQKAVEKGQLILRSQKKVMTGLKPGQRVNFHIDGMPEANVSFRTAPDKPAAYEAVVYGDTRTRHEMHRRVMEAVHKMTQPDFLIHTGDLVSDGRKTEQWPVFFDIERAVLRRSAFFPVLGNHERNDPQFYDFFAVQKPYMSFDWGAAHYTLINSDVGNAARTDQERDQFWKEQTKWMVEDLQKAQKAQFRFVVSHHPPFTAVKRRQDDKHPVKELIPWFEKYRVHAVFCGHDHNYQHHLFNGVRYVVTGGGGAPLYAADAPLPGITQKVETTENFVKLKVEPGKAAVTAVGLDGQVLDSFELKP